MQTPAVLQTEEGSLPILQTGAVSLPVIMPGAWGIHCCGCNVPAPDAGENCVPATNTGVDDSVGESPTYGCRCLMCPTWYACPACSEKEAAAHRDAHPQGPLFTYCVSAADEQATLPDLTLPPIRALPFIFHSFVLPFSEMFIPCCAVMVQVRVFEHACKHCSSRCRLCRNSRAIFTDVVVHSQYSML
jgi:hypothetical protein